MLILVRHSIKTPAGVLAGDSRRVASGLASLHAALQQLDPRSAGDPGSPTTRHGGGGGMAGWHRSSNAKGKWHSLAACLLSVWSPSFPAQSQDPFQDATADPNCLVPRQSAWGQHARFI